MLIFALITAFIITDWGPQYEMEARSSIIPRGQTQKNIKNRTTTELGFNTNIAKINWLNICESATLCNINVFGLQF